MCFSPEASFTASAVLAGIGYATVKLPKPSSLRLFAAVPLLFALQQFSEGVLWLHFTHVLSSSWSYLLAQHAYLFFAYLFWPVFFPLAILVAERESSRKLMMGLFLACGVVWTLAMLYLYHLYSPVSAQEMGHSIQYAGEDYFFRKLFYGSVIIVPCFLSSLRGMQLFGLLVLASYIISELFYQYAFTSVWCFFAAIVSASIYFIIKVNNKQEARR